MTTVRINRKALLMCFALCTWLFSACSKDEQTTPQTAHNTALNTMQFSFTEESFGEDEEVTRAQADAPAQTFDLGNGLEGEATLERESRPAATTRASIPISDGDYTIYAVKNGQRVPNALIKGKISTQGGKKVFTPVPNTKRIMELPGDDTYTFVCVNNSVTIQSDGRLRVNDLEKARIGTVTQTITGNKWKVHFNMKPCAARIRMELTAAWSFSNIASGLNSFPSQNKVVTYDVEGKNPQGSSLSPLMGNVRFANQGAIATAGTAMLTTPSNTYVYLAPGTDANKLFLRFSSGELYRKNLTGTRFPLRNFSATLQAGQSFTYKMKIYRSFLYLYSDGSTGTLVANRGKTPIAAVVSPSGSTTKKDGRAMALKDAGPAVVWSTIATQRNPTMNTVTNTVYNLYDGYGDTYNTNHANNTTMPAFYAAAHYNVARPSNAGLWYLPSLGEWKWSFMALGNLDLSSVTSWTGWNSSMGWDMNLYNCVFVQAGGTPHNMWYWASNEYTAANAWHVVIYGQDTPHGTVFAANDKEKYFMFIRSFLHFSNKS